VSHPHIAERLTRDRRRSQAARGLDGQTSCGATQLRLRCIALHVFDGMGPHSGLWKRIGGVVRTQRRAGNQRHKEGQRANDRGGVFPPTELSATTPVHCLKPYKIALCCSVPTAVKQLEVCSRSDHSKRGIAARAPSSSEDSGNAICWLLCTAPAGDFATAVTVRAAMLRKFLFCNVIQATSATQATPRYGYRGAPPAPNVPIPQDNHVLAA
jgi:hypothetical protein